MTHRSNGSRPLFFGSNPKINRSLGKRPGSGFFFIGISLETPGRIKGLRPEEVKSLSAGSGKAAAVGKGRGCIPEKRTGGAWDGDEQLDEQLCLHKNRAFCRAFLCKKALAERKAAQREGKRAFLGGRSRFFDEILKDLTYIPPEGREKKA